MKKIILIVLLLVLILYGVFVLRKKSTSENPLRTYTQNHEPYQDFPDIAFAVYMTPEEQIITYDKKSETYWEASLSDFITVLLPTLCGGECTDLSMATASVKLYSIGVDAPRKILQVTLVDKMSLESTQPTFFDLEGSFDGKNIRLIDL